MKKMDRLEAIIREMAQQAKQMDELNTQQEAAAAAAAPQAVTSSVKSLHVSVAPTSADISSFDLSTTDALARGVFDRRADAQPVWDEFGAVLLSTERLRFLAKLHRELVEELGLGFANPDEEHAEHFARQQTLISGQVMQTPIASIVEDSKLSNRTREVAKNLINAFRIEVGRLYTELTRGHWGNPNDDNSATKFSGTKSLVARLAAGLQALHWDTTRWGLKEPDVTALLYCTPCETAMLPRMPMRFVRYLTQPRGENKFAFLLRPEFMHSRRVEPGTLLLFRHVLPHAGTRNNPPKGQKRSGMRIVLFDMVVAKKKPAAGESQHFIWQRLLDAFGSKAPGAPLPIEYLASLRQHQLQGLDPLGHHPEEERALLRQLEKHSSPIASYLAASGSVVPQRPH